MSEEEVKRKGPRDARQGNQPVRQLRYSLMCEPLQHVQACFIYSVTHMNGLLQFRDKQCKDILHYHLVWKCA